MQATFGPIRQDIDAVMRLGLDGWVEDQFSRRGTAHYDYVRRYSIGSNRSARHEIWWRDAIEGEDQLRQRVAFALSQILVVSDNGYTLANSQWGVARYSDSLRENAFGNYRQLLEEITLSPDGSARQEGGRPLSAYSQADVETYARAFTGWNYSGASRWEQVFNGSDKVSPMVPFPGYC